jgi:hypothetical protein
MIFKILTILPLYYILTVNDMEAPPVFVDPMDNSQALSGTFGELRATNFHTGIDIKTNGSSGYNVYAVADGFVSRIMVSPVGYGKALYVDHANGYTSVYTHLNNFSIQIDDYVESQQYAKKSFAVNLNPDPGMIRVKQGEIIAFSGNSGSSMGPHLHFEIRKTSTQETLDPLMFNFTIIDNIAPTFHNLYVYPFGSQSHVEGQTKRVQKQARKYGKYFQLVGGDTIKALGRIGLAAHVNDMVNGSNNICGIVRLIVEINGEKTFELDQSKISFNDVRYVQSHSDFELSRNQKRRIHKCFVEPGNKFANYRNLKNNGYLFVESNDVLDVKISAFDSKKNAAIVKFVILGGGIAKETYQKPVYLQAWMPNRTNLFEDNLLRISVPADAVYDTLFFNYSVSAKRAKILSSVYKIGNPNNPLHRRIEVQFKNQTIPPALSDKIVLVEYSDKGLTLLDAKPTISGSDVKGNIGIFTDVAIACDTVPPTILPLNMKNGENMSAKKSIRIKIVDNLSGINTYEGLIDGQWILFEYDAKNNLLEYFFDHRMPKGKEHSLQIKVTDMVGNRAERIITFMREN